MLMEILHNDLFQVLLVMVTCIMVLISVIAFLGEDLDKGKPITGMNTLKLINKLVFNKDDSMRFTARPFAIVGSLFIIWFFIVCALTIMIIFIVIVFMIICWWFIYFYYSVFMVCLFKDFKWKVPVYKWEK